MNGNLIPGATNSGLQVSGALSAEYSVIVSNSHGAQTSRVAKITPLIPIAEIFNTGVDDAGRPLADGAQDSHYSIFVNPDGATSAAAVTANETIFPLASGPWLRNSATSRWIAPRQDSADAAAGEYVYRLTFSLDGLDPKNAFIAGQYAADDFIFEILLNGSHVGPFRPDWPETLSDFKISAGFVQGKNNLDFKVTNLRRGCSGLRIENLRGGRLLSAPQPSGADLKAGFAIPLMRIESPLCSPPGRQKITCASMLRSFWSAVAEAQRTTPAKLIY